MAWIKKIPSRANWLPTPEARPQGLLASTGGGGEALAADPREAGVSGYLEEGAAPRRRIGIRRGRKGARRAGVAAGEGWSRIREGGGVAPPCRPPPCRGGAARRGAGPSGRATAGGEGVAAWGSLSLNRAPVLPNSKASTSSPAMVTNAHPIVTVLLLIHFCSSPWFLVDVNPGASARGQPGPQVHQIRRGGWFTLALLLSENIT